jgi:hypothetical protein
LLEINDEAILNELISSFNEALEGNSVQKMNARSTFTIKGDRYWFADNGLVLSTHH